MIYSLDYQLEQIRYNVLKFLPDSDSSFDQYHSEAGRILEKDLEVSWYRNAVLENTGQSAIDFPFDPLLMFCGWNYTSDKTTAVEVNQRVLVEQAHTSGGTVGNIYASTSALPETNLRTIDFTTWTDKTSVLTDDLQDLACYKTLYLIYRFLANDQAEVGSFEKQRDYFDSLYKEEFEKVLNRGVPYDWDESGAIDSDEKGVAQQVQSRSLSVVW